MSVEKVSAGLKQALEDWEKAVDKFLNEMRKRGETRSAELEKQFKDMRTEGEKLTQRIGAESKEADKNLRKALSSLDERVKVAQRAQNFHTILIF